MDLLNPMTNEPLRALHSGLHPEPALVARALRGFEAGVDYRLVDLAPPPGGYRYVYEWVRVVVLNASRRDAMVQAFERGELLAAETTDGLQPWLVPDIGRVGEHFFDRFVNGDLASECAGAEMAVFRLAEREGEGFRLTARGRALAAKRTRVRGI
jgi:hypothetical protein